VYEIFVVNGRARRVISVDVMTTQSEQKVVDLVDAGVPADQGLSSLALLMQLAGHVLAAFAAVATFSVLFEMSRASNSNETLWVFLVLGLSIARSMMHRSAGAQLLYNDSGGTRLGGVQRYIRFALVQTALVVAVMVAHWHAPAKMALGVAAALAAWPVALVILLAMPRFRRFRDDLPITEDKGFEGAAILMTVLGLCGLIFGVTFLVVMLDAPGRTLTQGPGVLIVLAVAMLVARSAVHVQAGLTGLRETSVDRAVELANRYANFGVITSFCAAGALLLFVMSLKLDLTALAMISGLCWLLITWPLIVRRFFSERQFGELMAGEQAPIHRRAPDAGLTGLGWLLVAYGVFNAAGLLLGLVGGNGKLVELAAMFGGGPVRSPWWNVGVCVLQIWAGYELVRMSPQARAIATIYGAIGTAVTLYLAWPLIDGFRHTASWSPLAAMATSGAAIALVVPIATVLLVNRKIAPTARARFRSRDTK
jgi:hypothetical protein